MTYKTTCANGHELHLESGTFFINSNKVTIEKDGFILQDVCTEDEMVSCGVDGCPFSKPHPLEEEE